jgi:TonB family protein
MRAWYFLLAVALFASPASAAPKDWQPVGKWSFDTANSRCAAARFYSAGGKEVVLGITVSPTSDSGNLQFAIPRKFGGIWFEEMKIEIGGRRIKNKSAITSASAKAGHMLYDIGISRDELSWFSTAQTILISTDRFDADLPIQQAQQVLASLDNCTSDLLARWGLSRQDQARVAEYPKPEKPIHKYATSLDFPDSAVNRLAVGAIEARVTVGIDGMPSNCTIVRSSGHPDLDKATCKIAGRSRFKPAIDREGKPMVSPYHFKVAWVLGR